MKRIVALMAMVMITAGVVLAEKDYQTGKLVDVQSQIYTKKEKKINHENTLEVQVGDLIYFGQCEQKKNSDKCKPADWIVGDPVEVRFAKEFMYLKKTTGGEIKTRVVKKQRAN